MRIFRFSFPISTSAYSASCCKDFGSCFCGKVTTNGAFDPLFCEWSNTPLEWLSFERDDIILICKAKNDKSGRGCSSVRQLAWVYLFRWSKFYYMHSDTGPLRYRSENSPLLCMKLKIMHDGGADPYGRKNFLITRPCLLFSLARLDTITPDQSTSWWLIQPGRIQISLFVDLICGVVLIFIRKACMHLVVYFHIQRRISPASKTPQH